MSDTPAAVDERFRKLMMAMSPARRLAMACGMFATAKKLVRAGILEECGPKEPEQMLERLFLRFYGRDFEEPERKKILRSLKTT